MISFIISFVGYKGCNHRVFLEACSGEETLEHRRQALVERCT